MAIQTRAGKGSALTWAEVDNNFTELDGKGIKVYDNAKTYKIDEIVYLDIDDERILFQSTVNSNVGHPPSIDTPVSQWKVLTAAQGIVIDEYDVTKSYKKDEVAYVDYGTKGRRLFQSLIDNNLGQSTSQDLPSKPANTDLSAELFEETPQPSGGCYWDGNSLNENGVNGFRSGSTRVNSNVSLGFTVGTSNGNDPGDLDPDYATKLTNPLVLTIKENGVAKITLNINNYVVLLNYIGFYNKLIYKASTGAYYYFTPFYDKAVQEIDVLVPYVPKWKPADYIKDYYTTSEINNFAFRKHIKGNGPFSSTLNPVPYQADLNLFSIDLYKEIYTIGGYGRNTLKKIQIKFRLTPDPGVGIEMQSYLATFDIESIELDLITKPVSSRYQIFPNSLVAEFPDYPDEYPHSINQNVSKIIQFVVEKDSVEFGASKLVVKTGLDLYQTQGVYIDIIDLEVVIGGVTVTGEKTNFSFSDYYTSMLTLNTAGVALIATNTPGLRQDQENIIRNKDGKKVLFEGDDTPNGMPDDNDFPDFSTAFTMELNVTSLTGTGNLQVYTNDGDLYNEPLVAGQSSIPIEIPADYAFSVTFRNGSTGTNLLIKVGTGANENLNSGGATKNYAASTLYGKIITISN